MAVRSGFFNSINGDRIYSATHWAEYFATFIGNGVFPNPSSNLQIASNNNMTISVKAGKGWINGYILINDSDYLLDITPADGALNRIDRIVMRYDTVDREIRLEVKQGTFATNPTAPVLQRDADAFELALADIRVNAGAISISQANITDTRLNGDLCGIVHGVVDQVDTKTLFNQYQSWIAQEKLRFENDVDGWMTNEQDDFETWEQQQKNDFDMWFANIQDILGGNVAANLQNQITQLQADLGNIDAPSTQEFESLQSDFSAHRAESTTIKHKAKEIGLEDTANKFTAITVEGALEESINRANEAFQSASNGKTLISNAVTGVDDSVAIPPNPSFEDLAGVIGNLGGGIKSIQKGMHLKERMDKIASIAIETIDVSKSIVLFYARTIESHNVLNTVVDMYLANHSPGTLFGNFASRYNNTVERVVEVYWTVIEFEKAIVQRGVNTISDIGAYKRYSDIPIEPINLSRSMLLAEEISEGNSNNMSYLTKVSGANIVNESTIRFYQNSRIRWQVVEYE